MNSSDYRINNSVEDYLSLKSYNYSFFTSPEVTNLRNAVVPGSIKHMNEIFQDPTKYVTGVPSNPKPSVIGIGLNVNKDVSYGVDDFAKGWNN
jgi:hypothetical protein